jgi:hypothetical protein
MHPHRKGPALLTFQAGGAETHEPTPALGLLNDEALLWNYLRYSLAEEDLRIDDNYNLSESASAAQSGLWNDGQTRAQVTFVPIS